MAASDEESSGDERYGREACCGECGRVYKRVGLLPRITITRVVVRAPPPDYAVNTGKWIPYDDLVKNIDDRALSELAAGARQVFTINKQNGIAIAVRPFWHQGQTLYAMEWDVAAAAVVARDVALARIVAAFAPGAPFNAAARWKIAFPADERRWMPNRSPLADHPGFYVEIDDGIGWEHETERLHGVFTISLYGCPEVITNRSQEATYWYHLASLCEVSFTRVG